ncbi:VanZ family protein [Zavarzinella formosa]|uniref:VanZ family protein n=1 Tax=Zavarzinella formosa TaxID=360055 RepID=UPI0002D7E936|nr:VanZ family protein [Zavarzinella formosa]
MNSRPILGRRHYLILTISFLLFVIYGSLVPLHYEPVDFETGHAKFISRMTRGLDFNIRSDWAANVLLFIPLGFFCMGLLTVDRPKPMWGLPLIPFFTILSAAIEFAQIWFPPRDTTLNDVVAETIGGIIGVLGWLAFGQNLTDRFRQFMSAYGPGDWAVRVLPAYLLFLAFTEGMPFDLTMSPGIVWHKMKRQLDEREIREGFAMVDVVPPKSRVPEKTLMTTAYFVPVGVLIAFLPGSRWRRSSSAGLVFLAGLLVAGGIEGLQLIVVSCSAYASDILLGAICVLAGWKVASLPEPLPKGVWILGVLAWVVALTGVSWTPLLWQPDRLNDMASRFEWMPFREYIDSNYLNGMNKIIHRTMAYVPAGFLASRAIGCRSIVFAVLGGLLGMMIEAGQVVFTDHTASISDVILGSLGAWCGAVVAGRAAKNIPSGIVERPKSDVPPIRLL